MEISAEQLNRLKDGEYTVYDIRSETDRAYGFIPGSVHITAEELCENPPTDRDKKIIIYCAHGIFSIDVADSLCEQGYEAYSLEGGYLAWMRLDIKNRQDCELCQKVEQSLRKKVPRFDNESVYKGAQALQARKRWRQSGGLHLGRQGLNAHG